MKIIKPVLLFYNSVLLFFLITNGLVANAYSNLAPTLLLIPVGIYFALSLTDHLTGIFRTLKVSGAQSVERILYFYSLMMVSLLIFSNLAASRNWIQASLTIIFLPLGLYFLSFLLDRNQIKRFRLQKIIKYYALLQKVGRENTLVVKMNLADPAPIDSHHKKIIGKKKFSRLMAETGTSAANHLELETTTEVSQDELHPTQPTELDEITPDVEPTNIDIKDVRRRQFLKIIGGGGFTLFFMLFFMPQKASASFFGSTPGPGVVGLKDTSGNKIDPAEKNPTDGYNITEIDDATTPSYYGFVHKSGAWYIAKEDSAGAYRYDSGTANFSDNWLVREDENLMDYRYFDEVF